MTWTPPVTFDFTAFSAEFPEFAPIGSTLATSYFNRATFIVSNSASSLANCIPGQLQNLLYLLTAHIAWLNAPRDASGNPAATGAPASPIVGRIDQATEGSVSVHADMGEANAGSPSQAWYMTTRYGAEFWSASAQFRTARYAPQPTIVPGPVYPGYFGGWGGWGVY